MSRIYLAGSDSFISSQDAFRRLEDRLQEIERRLEPNVRHTTETLNLAENVLTPLLKTTVVISEPARVFLTFGSGLNVTANVAGTLQLLWQIKRQETVLEIYKQTYTATENILPMAGYVYIDDNPGLGSFTYTLEVLRVTVAGTYTVTMRKHAFLYALVQRRI